MSGCILHFGMHKTGSSSIQDTLHAALPDRRFHYVDLGRPNASAALTMAFSASPEHQINARKRGISRAEALEEAATARRRLEAELEQAREATCILSAEHVVFLKPGELGTLAECLARCGEPLRVVGYVRAPASYMESVFQQHLKGGRSDFDPGKMFPPYEQRFRRLEKAFGRERVEYWPFEPKSFPQGCVVRDFCARIGVDCGSMQVVRSNESLSLPAVRLLYAYRRFGPPYGTGRRAIHENSALARELGKLPGPRLRFHAALIEPILAQMRAQIAWMERRLGQSLGESLAQTPEALRSEHELLRFSDLELEWLAARTPGGPVAPDPAVVAARVDALRHALAAQRERKSPASGVFARLRRLVGAAD